MAPSCKYVEGDEKRLVYPRHRATSGNEKKFSTRDLFILGVESFARMRFNPFSGAAERSIRGCMFDNERWIV